jgi:hypothetical protein
MALDTSWDSKNCSARHSMQESEAALPCSQAIATDSSHEPKEIKPHPHDLFSLVFFFYFYY